MPTVVLALDHEQRSDCVGDHPLDVRVQIGADVAIDTGQQSVLQDSVVSSPSRMAVLVHAGGRRVLQLHPLRAGHVRILGRPLLVRHTNRWTNPPHPLGVVPGRAVAEQQIRPDIALEFLAHGDPPLPRKLGVRSPKQWLDVLLDDKAVPALLSRRWSLRCAHRFLAVARLQNLRHFVACQVQRCVPADTLAVVHLICLQHPRSCVVMLEQLPIDRL
mmetsp:Transcript_82272/g.246629  ORF Transcript_82272/g.246629 Transcript_82272/m.246629 type:complete len:217 (-) Transcript_82272:547-1197(-)